MNGILEPKLMSDYDLAGLGGGEVAYLREISPRTAKRLLKDAIDEDGNQATDELSCIPSNVRLYALHAADGTPIAIADTREGALANAIQQDLHLVQLN